MNICLYLCSYTIYVYIYIYRFTIAIKYRPRNICSGLFDFFKVLHHRKILAGALRILLARIHVKIVCVCSVSEDPKVAMVCPCHTFIRWPWAT